MATKKNHLHLRSFDEKDSFRIEVENYNGHGHLQIFRGKELLTEMHVCFDSLNILTLYPATLVATVRLK